MFLLLKTSENAFIKPTGPPVDYSKKKMISNHVFEKYISISYPIKSRINLYPQKISINIQPHSSSRNTRKVAVNPRPMEINDKQLYPQKQTRK